ncbi:MAG: epoxide hydrolase [Alphaproteobacteria bacterium]|nr:epoxide hydrolase [Alphaproteobacteria bacterium]
MPADDMPVPFEIAISDVQLADLEARLANVRWPEPPATGAWTYGSDLDYMRALVAYWRGDYDWRAAERRLNGFANYRAEIGGLTLHFIHQKGSGEQAMPLLLSHGWPGSVVEFLDIIEPLAHPERFGGDESDAFDVVVPSLPGYGFSGRPSEPIGTRTMAGLFHRLMVQSLGYARYGTQGGDWGSMIASWQGADHPKAVTGVHINMVGLRPHIAEHDPPLNEEERRWLAGAAPKMRLERGYREIQATRPQTLGYALSDSPVGLAAWIVDKFRAWGDTGGDIASRFAPDLLLTNIMLYWLTGTADSATWVYYASRADGSLALGPGERVTVPTGIAAFPIDLVPPPPRSWAERAYNVVHWTDMPSGGHFAALEEGERLVDDIRAFFRPLRKR